jgi:hypothetical protein
MHANREFCLRHPEVKDACDIGQMLFWNHKWAWYFTAVMFCLNNTFIQGKYASDMPTIVKRLTYSRLPLPCRRQVSQHDF